MGYSADSIVKKGIIYCDSCFKKPTDAERAARRCSCGGKIRITFVDTTTDTVEQAMKEKRGIALGEEPRRKRK